MILDIESNIVWWLGMIGAVFMGIVIFLVIIAVGFMIHSKLTKKND